MKTLRATTLLLATFLTVGTSSAAVLYNLDFTPPEIGTYQIINGSPSVQSSVGPFTDALVFHAVTTYDQIQLPINTVGTSYDLQCDVLVHNLLSSNYDFSIYLDTPEIRSFDFNGLSNSVSVFRPGETTFLGSLVNDSVYHLGLAVDLARNQWTVAVNGAQRYTGAFNATRLQDIRFSMAPASATSNAPTVYAALDNVVVTVVPEPSSLTLGIVAILGSMGWVLQRRRRMGLPPQR